MNLALLSGKGGTGKTFVSVNIANTEPDSIYLDCDVEEPDGDLFFHSKIENVKPVKVKMPVFDKEKCTACHKCVKACKFNALALIGKDMLLFDDICHSCGVCVKVCEEGAVTEIDKTVGKVEIGKSGSTTVITGRMNMGQSISSPIIKATLKEVEANKLNVIDCPPGSACSVVESLGKADYCLLVAEPTSFGLHNFMMVEELVRVMNKPFAVVINKAESKDNVIQEYCDKVGIKIFETFMYDKKIARDNSEGKLCTNESEPMRKRFIALYDKVKESYR